MSRIHLLMLSIDESHSRCPGALSLRSRKTGKEEDKRNNMVKNRNTSQAEGWRLKIGQKAAERRGQTIEGGRRRSSGGKLGVKTPTCSTKISIPASLMPCLRGRS